MQFNKTVLKNGLRVITVPMTDNPSVTVMVTVETGSRYESKQTNGLSHFLEHMVFKGTPSRPKAIDISHELDSLGADFNAYTGLEKTSFYIKANNKFTDNIIDIISDIYLNPLLEQNEIEKEKGVIIEEMKMYNDLPQRKVGDVMSELLYGDQPAGWNIIGTEENIRAFSRKDFVQYLGEHYVSSATVVTVAGGFDEKDIIPKIEKAFSKVSANDKKESLPITSNQTEPQIRTFFKETDQSHMLISFRAFSFTDERTRILGVLSAILGGGMSSRLFSKMREDLGICYYINSSVDPATDVGDITISAGLDNNRVEEGIKAILAEIVRLKKEPVTEKELQKIKDGVSASILMDLETSYSRAEYASTQETMRKKLIAPEQIVAEINAITAAQIQAVANEVFVNEKANLAIVGRFKDGTSFAPYFMV